MFALFPALLAAAAAVKAPPPPIGSLSWLPASTQSISGAPGDKAPLLNWLRTTPRYFPEGLPGGLPVCWTQVTAPIVASYQVWAGLGDKQTAVLVQGRVDRKLVESCLETTLRALRSPPRLSRRGAVTDFETERFGNWSIGWTRSWVVIHASRARVEELVAALPKKKTISPTLAAAIARVDRSRSMWFATTLDYSGVFIGVPSRSLVGSLAELPSRADVHLTFEFASIDDAIRATHALAEASTDGAVAPPIRAIAHDARFVASDNFMELDLDAKLLLDDATMSALQAWMEKKQAELAKP